MTQNTDLSHLPEPDPDAETARPPVADVIETGSPDPATQATDILDAENKGLNDPGDAGEDRGDEDPDEFDDELNFEEDEDEVVDIDD